MLPRKGCQILSGKGVIVILYINKNERVRRGPLGKLLRNLGIRK